MIGKEPSRRLSDKERYLKEEHDPPEKRDSGMGPEMELEDKSRERRRKKLLKVSGMRPEKRLWLRLREVREGRRER